MIYLELNSTDYSDYLKDGSTGINDQIQNKANTLSFKLNAGFSTIPEENHLIRVFDYVSIVSVSGVDVVIKDELSSGLGIIDRGKFRKDYPLYLSIGTADEEKVMIDSIEQDGDNINITLSEAVVNSHSANNKAGKLVFGGTLSSVKTTNPKQLTDVEADISATDFTKIFDKKLLNDAWEDRTALYIMNDALNTTINFQDEIDDMDYDDDAAVQLVWAGSGDGQSPTLDEVNFIQREAAVNFAWVNSGGTATFTRTGTIGDQSAFVGVASGAPVSGKIKLWYFRGTTGNVTTFRLKYGSDASNYVYWDIELEEDTDRHLVYLQMDEATVVGTPDWTAVDYCVFDVTETGDGNITIDDMWMLEDQAFTLNNFEEGLTFDKASAAFKKPTVFIDRMAKVLEYYWYIDYERDIHFFDQETSQAPFEITEDTMVFDQLSVKVDTSQLRNRQTVRGSTEESASTYSQTVEGDEVVREWVLKSHFANLVVKYDDGTTDTHAAEAGTTTTNIKITGHGLETGDYVVNRTRSTAPLKITKVDDDNFTVETVASQTSGDTISFFVTVDIGVENLVDETTVDYVWNYEEKSVRASSTTDTMPAGEYLAFFYNEILPIRVTIPEPSSIFAMKALLGGDGIFDGPVISDESIDTRQAARDRAQAELNQYSNPIVEISFKTAHEGLKSGQIIRVTDSNRGIDDDYLIQKVKAVYKYGDYVEFTVTCASTLFGIIEYFQKISENLNERAIDENEVIDLIVSDLATVTVSEVNQIGASHEVVDSDTITAGESNSVVERDMTTDPYKWQPDASDFRWNLGQWG